MINKSNIFDNLINLYFLKSKMNGIHKIILMDNNLILLVPNSFQVVLY